MIALTLVACGSKLEKNSDPSKVDKNISTTETMDEIYTYLEETVTIEKSFDEIQTEINVLEQQDDELYNEIIQLEMEEHDKVVELSTEAIELLEQRFDLLEKEKDILTKSKIAFDNIEALLGGLTDEEIVSRADKLFDTMMERYAAYDLVYDVYQGSLLLTKDLYVLFQEEVYDEETMLSLISDINESYDAVLDANEIFNETTILYNGLKKEFYDYLNTEN